MTNQASELYELCKEVYERTGWEDVRDFYHENDTFDEETQTFKRNGIFSIVERKRADYNTPLYTSDYILKKLPVHIDRGVRAKHLLVYEETIYPYTENCYRALYEKSEYQEYSDTPLKALLKLTIALSEAGEL